MARHCMALRYVLTSAAGLSLGVALAQLPCHPFTLRHALSQRWESSI